MARALWRLIETSGIAPRDMLIFLPSRRAVRTVEKMIVEKCGGAAILPRLVALGEGADEFDEGDADDVRGADVIPNAERVAVMAKLLTADANIGTLSNALPVARDLVRLTDYLENEGVDISAIDWPTLVDEKYSDHFRGKAEILKIITRFMAEHAAARVTVTAKRNADIRAWRDYIADASCGYKLIIVCSSTASVPATRDLMIAVARDPRGRIILPGYIADAHLRESDMQLDTNPYNAEYKFLAEIGVKHTDVQPIDVGPSAIKFMNAAFGNDAAPDTDGADVAHCHLVECDREYIEAAAVATIAQNAIAQNKSVLVITPDAAGNQRIATAFAEYKIDADFSGGIPGSMTDAGRAILNQLDEWIEQNSTAFEKLYHDADNDLMETIIRIVDARGEIMRPVFDCETNASMTVWRAIRNMSDAIRAAGLDLTAPDARAFIADALACATVRNDVKKSQVCVLGTIESRMQTADVVILTGLNDGMFPARGYENAWLPRRVAMDIGLPPGDRKVSLMSLDFMNLSCGADVWWLRAKNSGGAQTTESRFISRVIARHGHIERLAGKNILSAVAARDTAPSRPLDYSPPCPPHDWSDVYVTELEALTHNPYMFYVRHILKLKEPDNYWDLPAENKFGDIVHDVLAKYKSGDTCEQLVARMDAAAHELLKNTGSLRIHFWHNRFMEIAPIAIKQLEQYVTDSATEKSGQVVIADRVVRARADRIWPGGVMDIKTGRDLPTRPQMEAGNMPQLPLEAYMLQSGGFHGYKTDTPEIVFLHLSRDAIKSGKTLVPFDFTKTEKMIAGTVQKITDLFNMYSAGGAPYEYFREQTNPNYLKYRDLARIDD